MRKRAGVLLCIVLATAGGIFGVAADPLESSSPEPVLPDPKPDNGVNFSPATATKDVAHPSVELSSAKPLGSHGCSALSPCAAPTPALGSSKTLQPSRAN
jgi:hypothetical protein